MSHTPGPWRICGGGRKGWIRIDAGAVKPDGDPDSERGGETLFDTSELNDLYLKAKRRVIADYHLAAAAPEMFEALTAIMKADSDLEGGGTAEQYDRAYTKAKRLAKKAIAKAKGGK